MNIKIKDIKKYFNLNKIKFSTKLKDNTFFSNLGSILNAKSNEITFFIDEKLINILKNTKAKACLIKKEFIHWKIG